MQEQILGTDPLKNDTDGDGMTDFIEYKMSMSNPTDPSDVGIPITVVRIVLIDQDITCTFLKCRLQAIKRSTPYTCSLQSLPQ